jgi:hypothetical protein
LTSLDGIVQLSLTDLISELYAGLSSVHRSSETCDRFLFFRVDKPIRGYGSFPSTYWVSKHRIPLHDGPACDIFPKYLTECQSLKRCFAAPFSPIYEGHVVAMSRDMVSVWVIRCLSAHGNSTATRDDWSFE